MAEKDDTERSEQTEETPLATPSCSPYGDDPPQDVIEAAIKLEGYFKMKGNSAWELMGVRSRKLPTEIEDMRQAAMDSIEDGDPESAKFFLRKQKQFLKGNYFKEFEMQRPPRCPDCDHLLTATEKVRDMTMPFEWICTSPKCIRQNVQAQAPADDTPNPIE